MSAVTTLDFLSGMLPSGVTFARSTVAQYVDANGLLVDAAINQPRFDYATPGAVALGLLLEPAATNRLLRSNTFTNATWQKLNFSTVGLIPAVTADAALAPDGTMTASSVVLDAVNSTGQSSLQQALSLGAGAYTLSIWARVPTGAAPASVNLRMDYTGGSVSENRTVTSTWTRYTLVVPSAPDLKSAVVAKLRPATGTATTATLLLWGAQVESSAVASSYIATAAAPATRAADVAGLTGFVGSHTVDITYSDNSTATLFAQNLSSGYWPALTKPRLRSLVLTPEA